MIADNNNQVDLPLMGMSNKQGGEEIRKGEGLPRSWSRHPWFTECPSEADPSAIYGSVSLWHLLCGSFFIFYFTTVGVDKAGWDGQMDTAYIWWCA